jgi:hypothetical protein
MYFTYKIKNLTLGVHDFFYFNKVDSINDFLFETGKTYLKDSSLHYRDGHYYEIQIKYNAKKLSILAAYNFYNTTSDIYKNTIYFESEYKFNNNFSTTVGFTTGASALNFYTDQYNSGIGFTCIGVNWMKTLKITDSFSTDMKIIFHINPNYKNIQPGLQKTPVNMGVSLSF